MIIINIQKLFFFDGRANLIATESLGIDEKKKELKEFVEKVIRSVFNLNEHLDLYPILIEATLDVRCCMSKDSSRKISLNCFDAVIKVKDIENISDPIFSEHVMNIVIFLCHESPWESKLLGCKAIDLLLQESSYEYKYPMFLKPLLYVMSDLQGKVSFGSIVDASELLHKKLLPRIVASHTASDTGKEKSFDTTISILNEEIMSNNYLIRKEARKCFNSLSTISKKRVSDLVKSFGNAMPVASLIYLYEDFKFSKEAKFTISDKNKEDYFSQLKEICMSHLKHEENIKKTCHTPTGYNLKIQKCCGALHALCFNLVKNKIEEIFDIFCHAAHSPIHEILHAGLRCLEDILKNDKIQVSDKMIEELLLKFYGPFVEMEFLKVSNFLKLEFILKMFPIQSVETVLKILRSIKKNIFCDSGNDMKMLKVKLEGGARWITILTIKTLAYVDQSVVEEVISFVIDIEKNLSSKNISSKLLFKGFRESLLKFCKTFFEGAVSYFMSKNLEIRKIFFKDFSKDDIIQNCIGCKMPYIITLTFNLNLDSCKQIIGYIIKCNDNWLKGKNDLLELLHEEWMHLEFQNIYSVRTFKILTTFIIRYYKCNPLKENLIFRLLDECSFPAFKPLQSLYVEITKDFLLNIARVINLENKKELKDEASSYFCSCFQKKKPYAAEVFQWLIIPLHENGILEETVLREYFKCVNNPSLHTENFKILFLKFFSAIAQTAFHMIGIDSKEVPYFSIFERRENEFHLKDSPLEKQIFYATYLLVSSLCPEIFPVFLEYCEKYYPQAKDFHALVIDLLIAEHNKELLCDCIQNFTCEKVCFDMTDILYHQYKNLMNIILTHREVIHSHCHVFTNLMVNFAVHLGTESASIIDKKMAIDLIEVIIVWGYFYKVKDPQVSTFYNDRIKENAKLVTNFLFTTTFIDIYGLEFIFKKCLSVLVNQEFAEVLNFFNLQLEIFDEKVLTSILDDPQKCEGFVKAFETIADAFDPMPGQNWISSVVFLERNMPSQFNCKRIHSLFEQLSKFSQRKDVQKYRSQMYTAIFQTNDRYYFYVKVVFEADECPSDNIPVFIDTVVKSALIALKNRLKILNVEFTEVKDMLSSIYYLLYEVLPPLIEKVSLKTMLTVIEILNLCFECMIQNKNFTYFISKESRGKGTVKRELCLSVQYIPSYLQQDMSLFSTIYNQMLDLSAYKIMSEKILGYIIYLHKLIYEIEMKDSELFKNWTITDDSYAAKKWRQSLLDVLVQIIGNMKISNCWKTQCILLLRLDVRVNFTKTSEGKDKESLFNSIVDLCLSDFFLLAHVWNHMFTGIFKIFNNQEQGKLDQDMELLLKKSPNEKKLLNPSPLEVFIHPAIECMPQLCNSDNEHLFRSFTTQVLCAMSLEKYIFSRERENNAKNIKMLEEIYCNLGEPDLIYSLYQSLDVIKNVHTFEAVLYQLNGNSFSAGALYIQAIKKKVVTKDQPDVYKFVKTQLQRCMKELERWSWSPVGFENDLIENLEFSVMKDAFPMVGNEAISKTPQMQCIDIDNALLKCIERWQYFPGKILSNNHYSVLQLLQLLTELLEVRDLRNKTFEIHAENLKRWHSMWKSGKYELSDDQNFLSALFNVRLSAYGNFLSMSSDKQVTKLRDDVAKLRDEFYSTAINNGKCLIHLGNEKDPELNSYDSIKDCFSWLLLQVKKNEHTKIREHQPKDMCKMIAIAPLILTEKKYWSEKFDEKEIHSLNGYIEEIRNELIYKRTQGNKISSSADWKPLIKHVEESCLVKDENYTVMYLKYLLQTCKLGNKSFCIKFITKILWSIQSAHEMPSIIKFFEENNLDIPLHYWLPFLSLLILYAFQPKVGTKENEQLLKSTSFLPHVLIQLAKEYPQETFFAIWKFKSSIVTQDLKEKEMMVAKCNKVFNIMESVDPRLISSLKEMMTDLQKLKSDIREYHYHSFMLIMEKTYHSLFLILKNKKSYSEPEIVEECKNSVIECYQSQYDSKVSDFIDTLKSKNTVAEVLSLLTSTIQDYFQELKNKSVLLTEECKFLSSYHTLCRNIKMLPKYHTLVNSISSPVKIAKFLPNICIHQWVNCFAYKLDVCGDDGKEYSYMLMENDYPKETWKSDNFMQFLEIVNMSLAESDNCSKNFLKFRLPSIFSISPSLKLMPFSDSQIPYLDIFKKDTRFLPNFDQCLIQDYFKYIIHIKMKITNYNYDQDYSLSMIKNEELFNFERLVPDNVFTHWVNNVYSHHDQFFFKKQFLRDFAMEFSAELLNLSSRKERIIHRKFGRMSPLYLEFMNKNLIENIPAAECVSVLTPNLKKFFGPNGLAEIVNNVYRVSSVLQEDQRYLIPLLLMFLANYGSEVYTKEEMEISEKQMTAFIGKRIGMSRVNINSCLEITSPEKLDHLSSFFP